PARTRASCMASSTSGSVEVSRALATSMAPAISAWMASMWRGSRSLIGPNPAFAGVGCTLALVAQLACRADVGQGVRAAEGDWHVVVQFLERAICAVV